MTSKEVKDKFSISPENFCLAKSICGDPSDNIDGVPSVGFKTLAKRIPELKSSESLSIQDVVDKCKLMVDSGSTLKAVKNICESKDLIKRNWKLIYLDTFNLSHNQIEKINYSVDTFSPTRNKIKIMKILLKNGIQTFNIDRLLLSLNHIR